MSSKQSGEAPDSGEGDARNSGEESAAAGLGSADGTRWWVSHRADVEWRTAMHVAAAEYADHVTAAFGTYQHALADLVKDANEKELAALPAELDSGDAADRPAAIEETFQRWRSAIDEGQDAMLRGVSAAQRELAEVWQRSWLDLVDKHAEANRQYQRARADALGPEQAITAPAPFVAGDEGLAIPPQAPGWAGWAAPWTAQWGT